MSSPPSLPLPTKLATSSMVDGFISRPELCDFDPLTIINTTVPCPEFGSDVQISDAAAQVALATWTGARSRNGTFLWHGLGKDAPLSGLANTTCDYQGNGKCSGARSPSPEIGSSFSSIEIKNSISLLSPINTTRGSFNSPFKNSTHLLEQVIQICDHSMRLEGKC